MSLIPKSLNDLAKKVVDKVQEYRQPEVEINPDEHRIDREVQYAKRIRKVNPKLQALNERRLKAQKRRSL